MDKCNPCNALGKYEAQHPAPQNSQPGPNCLKPPVNAPTSICNVKQNSVGIKHDGSQTTPSNCYDPCQNQLNSEQKPSHICPKLDAPTTSQNCLTYSAPVEKEPKCEELTHNPCGFNNEMKRTPCCPRLEPPPRIPQKPNPNQNCLKYPEHIPQELPSKCNDPCRIDDSPICSKPAEPVSGATPDYSLQPPQYNEGCNEQPPCYLPKDTNKLYDINLDDKMGPIGPWATGRIDWSPMAGLTGTRPVVDRYSITRYSTNEWKKRNKDVLDDAFSSIDKSQKCQVEAKNTMTRTYVLSDQTQSENTERLVARAKEVEKWKMAIERAIRAQADEISTLEEERLRLKQALTILDIPEAIATECIDRRSSRPDSELVRDRPEEELIKEIALISEIRGVMNRTLRDIEAQQIENRTARQRLEYDWSDKKMALEGEIINCGLNNKSTITLFKPGATRFPADQSSVEYYEHFSKQTLDECERSRQRSINLRSTLDAILLNAARDLRTQADVTEQALSYRISCMEEMRTRLEHDLKSTLQNIADTEQTINKLTWGIKNMDTPMKVAQTRLDNRNQRPHVENCRDAVQSGLIGEVQVIQDGVSAMLENLKAAENIKRQLVETRGKLELEIIYKRRSIMLDRDRGQWLRSHFPSAAALTGTG